ncbi:MAG TPA: STT3 domain-containing protein [Candidatus Thermoplasmatota archaeon]|nr:STT3 domain-containing protein [Candidatus Thermoplasmatota archaeon]
MASFARSNRSLAWIAAVAGVVLLAFFVRTYFSVDAAAAGNEFRMSESDAYFMKHTVDRIQGEGFRHPTFEPLLNYPIGSVNPNPPLWTWWIATWGATLAPLFPGEAVGVCAGAADAKLCESTWWVALLSPALFGAGIVLLIYLIGAAVFDRRVGLFAAFFLATSTGSIGRSVLGFADHDAIALFFIVAALYFFVLTLRALREAGESERPDGFVASIAHAIRTNSHALALAGLAGAAIGATALVWKGQPYIVGILVVFGVLQLLLNHWRNRDASALWIVTLVALVVGMAIPTPTYLAIGEGFLGNISAGFYLTAIFALVGGLFVAARDYPFVLVFPAFVASGVLAVAAIVMFAPSIAHVLFDPIFYFKSGALYQTIAEAQAADFNFLVFNTGVVASFLALVAIPWILYRHWRSLSGPVLLVLAWSGIAIWMAYTTVRFTFNATPAFALLGGWATAALVGMLRYEQISKTMSGLRGDFVYNLKRSVQFRHVMGAIVLTFGLILPNVWLAVDAGMAPETANKLARAEAEASGKGIQDTFVAKRFGAFGQSLIPPYWHSLNTWLAQQDPHLAPHERPAYLSWWDYGHWAASIGKHPAVADNFQNGVFFSGNFITSQDETHAVQLLSARLMELADSARHPATRADFERLLVAAGVPAADAPRVYDDLRALKPVPELPKDRALAFLLAAEALTGKSIRYFAVDARMFPFDVPDCNPQSSGYSPTIDHGSIFYAPVILSEHAPDDYVGRVVTYRETAPTSQGRTITVPAEEWQRLQQDVRNFGSIEFVCEKFRFKAPYYNSMFHRAWVGTPVTASALGDSPLRKVPTTFPQETREIEGFALLESSLFVLPGYGLEHFRVVFANDGARVLRFYQGAELSGRVQSGGAPMQGVHVVAFDDAGADLWPLLGNLGIASYRPDFARVAALEIVSGELPASVRADLARILGVEEADLEQALARNKGRLTEQVFDDAGRIRASDARNNLTKISEHLARLDAGSEAFRILTSALDVPHATRVTDEEGRYTIPLPFGTRGPVTVRFFKDGVEIASLARAVTPEQAETGARLSEPGDVEVVPGHAAGVVFLDSNQNGVLDDGESPLGGIDLRIGRADVRANDEGAYAVQNLPPGGANVTLVSDRYVLSPPAPTFVGIEPGQTARHDIALVLKPVTARGTLWADENGNDQLDEGEEVVTEIRFVPDPSNPGGARVAGVVAGANGTWTVDLAPGRYVARADAGGSTLALPIEVAEGEGVLEVGLATRMVPAAPVVGTLAMEGGTADPSGFALTFTATEGGLDSLLHDRQPVRFDGNFALWLVPGTYLVEGQKTTADGVYRIRETLEVTDEGARPSWTARRDG